MRTKAIVTASTIFASAALAAPTAALAAPQPVTPALALSRAANAISTHAAAFAASDDDAFQQRRVMIDSNGVSHVHLNRTYRGLEVLGGDVIAHLNGTGALGSVTRTQKSALSLSTTAKVTKAQAVAAAVKALGGTAIAGAATDLVVDARGTTPALVYRTLVQVADEATYVLVDAATGAVVDHWDEVQTVEGTGKGLNVGTVTLDTTLSGSTYQLKDPTRGNNYTTDMNNRRIGTGTLFTDADNVWGTGSTSNEQTVAVDAQYATATTWDYYLNEHGREGIADDGAGSYNKVHYGSNYANAGWSDSCFCMIYGDGDGTTLGPVVSLDVGGHEMTHGVTSRTAGLTYSGQSGGLNESMSDVFGTLVEFYAANTSDVADYLIGEEVMISDEALRWMDDPSKDGASAKCYSSSVGNLDVHYSSGVGNHAFFLLAVGSGSHTVNGVTYNSPTCNSGTVTGIGNDDAGAIWYRALTTYMTSSTNYSQARTATLNAAADLFGSSSTQYAATAAAWSAVSVS